MVQSRDYTDLINGLSQMIEATHSSVRQMTEAIQIVRGLVAEQIDPSRRYGDGPAPLGYPDPSDSVETIDPRPYASGGERGFAYGRFLQEQNPYGAESVDPAGTIEAIGPARKNGRRDPFRRPLREFTPLEVDECPRWTFGQQTYRVTKAIRIPYRYTHPVTGQGIEASILIGFQGPGY